MTTIEMILGAAMTVFVFINFFVKSWFICLAIIVFAVGCIYAMPTPLNPFLMWGVALVAVGEIVGMYILKHRES